MNETTLASTHRSGRRVHRAVLAIALGLTTLTACSSNPGPKRVAFDIIDTAAIDNPSLDGECLKEKLDEFSDDELKAILEGLKKSDSADQAEAEKALEAFKVALSTCI